MSAAAPKIARLNDAFRKAATGNVFKTAGIDALPPSDQAAIIDKVRAFDQFNAANDPYGEHDFGSLDHNGETVFFKIDYYDKNMTYGSEHPEDESQTTRVMTIMLASEY